MDFVYILEARAMKIWKDLMFDVKKETTYWYNVCL